MKDIFKTLLKHLLKKGTFRSYSQFGEDAIVAALFRKKRDGTYIDIGTYHPHLYSNTYAFYRRGWKGLVIDPNSNLQRLYRLFRPRDTFVLGGVGLKGKKTYRVYSDPAYNGFGNHDIAPQLIREYEVAVESLGDLIKRFEYRHIDLLSIDTEGMEDEILSSYTWEIEPTVVIIESHRDSAAEQLLVDRGYSLVGESGLSLIFQKKKVQSSVV
jgi:FkbM family methyltransferase